jgi:hypothetical protein
MMGVGSAGGGWRRDRVHAKKRVADLMRAGVAPVSWTRIVAAALLALALCPASIAQANSLRGWGKANSDCSGSCNMRGIRSDITFPGSSWVVVNSQDASESVQALSTGNAFTTVGGILKKNVGFGDDCVNGSNDTSGHIRNFDETTNNAGTASCTVYSTPNVEGQTHTYKSQRWAQIECGVANCVANFIDTAEKQDVVFPSDEFDQGNAVGELVRTSGTWENSSTFVMGTFPGSGTKNWSRTSDVFVSGGGSATWTDITSAGCVLDAMDPTHSHGHWFVGNLSGGFEIHFADSNPGGNCT